MRTRPRTPTRATISGVVVSDTGAPIANVAVTARHADASSVRVDMRYGADHVAVEPGPTVPSYVPVATA